MLTVHKFDVDMDEAYWPLLSGKRFVAAAQKAAGYELCVILILKMPPLVCNPISSLFVTRKVFEVGFAHNFLRYRQEAHVDFDWKVLFGSERNNLISQAFNTNLIIMHGSMM
mmetsp:Transcript_27206/g.56674  ORF Transcript_27206/g.56674 Transcript_27206/m.56674 type:complete len:112 (-) Transcript_27206:9-344(-)